MSIAESIKVTSQVSITKEIKNNIGGIVLEMVPSFCKDCRNLKGVKCKKGLEPKGKFAGGLKCARYHKV